MKARSKIGAFEAKTNLSTLLQHVEQGKEFIITKHNKPVAVLSPFVSDEAISSRRVVVEQLTTIRHSVIGNVNIRDFINEGRR